MKRQIFLLISILLFSQVAYGGSQMIKVKGIDHLNMTVNSLEESIEFYNKLFGFEVVEDSRRDDIVPNKLGTPYAVIGVKGAAYLVLHQSPKQGNGQDNSAPTRLAHMGFHVEDFDTLMDKLQSFGVSFRQGPAIVKWDHSRSIYILDPSGHEIELVENFGGREI